MEGFKYRISTLKINKDGCAIRNTEKWQASFFDLGDAMNYFLNMVDSIRLSKRRDTHMRVVMERVVNGEIMNTDVKDIM